MKIYKVKVATTNALKSTTYGPEELGQNTYRDCVDGILYVVTADPRTIYDEFPLTISIEEIGIGYNI